MEQKRVWKRILASLFFLGGLVLIFYVILLIGREQGFARPKFHVTVLYRDVRGLIEGAPVRLSGVNVGNVADIDFLKQDVRGRRVAVIVNVLEEYRAQLEGKNAKFLITPEGVLGQKLVEIVINESGEALDLTEPLLGEDSIDVEDLAVVFADAAESFTETSSKLSQINMDELSMALTDTAVSVSKTSDGLRDILKEMKYLSIKTKRLINRFEEKLIEGNLFKVF